MTAVPYGRRRRPASHKAPRMVEVEVIPRSAAAKVNRSALVEARGG